MQHKSWGAHHKFVFRKFILFLELFHLPGIHDAKQREEKIHIHSGRGVGTQVQYIDERLHDLTSRRAAGRVDKPPRPMKILTALSASSHNIWIVVSWYTMKEDGCSGHKLFNIKHRILYIIDVIVLMHKLESKMQQNHSCWGHAHNRIKVLCHQVDP